MSFKARSLLWLSSSLLAMPLAGAGPASAAVPAVAPARAAATTTATPTPTVESTAWVSHTTRARLSHLPRHYSCADLQSRLRDMLLVLGARPDMDIEASECEFGAEGYSPQVHLQFAMPSQLLGASTVVTGSTAALRTVRLAPGQLGSWARGDCELMRQLKEQLLPQLTQRIVAFSLSCLAPAINSEHYSVIVQTADPSRNPAKLAAAHADSRPLAR